MSNYTTDWGGICNRAIQDLAPLLPLLGTEVSGDRVAWALDNGLLYPAAAPMTIFGSFGIIMVGFITLIGSIDLPYFHGPTRMKNAGFRASGMGTLLLHVNKRKHHLYQVEDRLRTILAKKKVLSVEVNIFSRDIVSWNLRLAISTFIFSCLGITPYIPLIVLNLRDRPFHETWLYPVLRIAGCGTIAVSLQLLFQLRILEEIYYRLRFLAADHYLKTTGKSLPEFWDPNRRSRSVFVKLRQHLRRESRTVIPPSTLDQQLSWLLNVLSLRRTRNVTPSAEEGASTGLASPSLSLTTKEKSMFLDNIHTLSTFKFEIPISAPSQASTPAPGTPGRSSQPNTPIPADRRDIERGIPLRANSRRNEMAESIILFCAQHITTLGLVLNLVLLLTGVGLAIYGYVGCFGIVQANRDPDKWAGPVAWFIIEGALFFVRTTIWAWNPKWDDPPSPIVLEKESTEFGGSQDDGAESMQGREANNLATEASRVKEKGKDTKESWGNAKEGDTRAREGREHGKKKFSYGIGWKLESLTADDMHAIIIGIDDYDHTRTPVEGPSSFANLTSAKSDAKKIEHYLERTLLVPSQQIRTLYDSAATKDRIVEEIRSLKHRVTVTRHAPIVIFYAGHSCVSSGTTYFVPYQANLMKKLDTGPESDWLPYSEVVDILRQIGEEKTDNIVLILDCCHAGAIAKNNQWAQSSHLTLPEGSANAEKRPRTVHSVVTKDTPEILIGHASHILLAGAAADQSSYEVDGGKGGQFTSALLKTLEKAEKDGDLKRLTYKDLVQRITEEFEEVVVPVLVNDVEQHHKLSQYQKVLCTTIYQEQPLFDGLFKRRRDEASKPVVTVKYSD